MTAQDIENEFVLGPEGQKVPMEEWISALTGEFPEGQIPKITVIGDTLPEVWERAVLATWFHGCEVKTQYDQPGDPPSRDCTIIMVMRNPLQEPMIHKGFPGGLYDLENYRQEVVDGIHDSWIDLSEGSTKWPYTYHDRLFNYNPNYPEPGPGIDQIANIIEALAEVPHSRRVQAITWYPWFDPSRADPPCLQRIWCRLLPNENGQLVLNMDFNMRSWDAFKAAYMNYWAFADLERLIVDGISQRRGEPILAGDLTGIGDSFHIYGADFQDSRLPLSFQGFLESLKIRPWEERIIRSNDPDIQEMFEEARAKIAQKQQKSSN